MTSVPGWSGRPGTARARAGSSFSRSPPGSTAAGQRVHRRLAQEGADEQVGRAVAQLVRRAVLLQDARLHHRDAVGHGVGLGLVVGDENGG